MITAFMCNIFYSLFLCVNKCVAVSEQARMAAEVMDFDCEVNPTEFSEESELEIEMESGESLDSDGALESRIIQPIVSSVTGQVLF